MPVTAVSCAQLSLALKQSEEDTMILNVHKRNASGETALHINAIKGNVRLVRLLIQHVRGRVPPAPQRTHPPPLHA